MIWIIGAGLMAAEYAKVLNALGTEYLIIGRGRENAEKLEKEYNAKVVTGGLVAFLQTSPALPEKVIVAVGIEALFETTKDLLAYGVKDILLEKPGGAYPSEIVELAKLTEAANAKVLLAYNRRFYSSVLKAEELIAEDGGPQSMHFEFTEWSHVISTFQKTDAEWHNWFLGNSTHVVDTAFFLAGKPQTLNAQVAGSLNWHPASSRYAGSGVTDKQVLFSYFGDWSAPGRWNLEVLTPKRRFIFKPMESLQVTNLGTVAVVPVEVDNKLDVDFKPGLYLQTKAYLENDLGRFADIREQADNVKDIYLKMSGYSL